MGCHRLVQACAVLQIFLQSLASTCQGVCPSSTSPSVMSPAVPRVLLPSCIPKSRAVCPCHVGGSAFLTFPPSLPRLDPLQKITECAKPGGFCLKPKACLIVLSTLRGFVLGRKGEFVLHQPREAQAAWEYIEAQHMLDLPHSQSD